MFYSSRTQGFIIGARKPNSFTEWKNLRRLIELDQFYQSQSEYTYILLKFIRSPKVSLLNGIGQNPTDVRSSDKLVMVREEGQFSIEDFSKTNEG
jgi:hypothetical protein